MVRKVMRRPAVLTATGWCRASLYAKIAEGKFPKGTKLDPDGNAVVWFEDEVEAWQKAAVTAAMEAA
jgi:predicted DNA-binding transcriptional regulator AlpA